jgi:hypothetical protein
MHPNKLGVSKLSWSISALNITEFLSKVGLKSHGTVVNSWDAFGPGGVFFMQLWQGPDQRIRNHPNPSVYLRVRCFDAAKHAENAQRQAVGYAGRLRAIRSIEEGAVGFSAMSLPPGGARGPGVWAKHADLDRVYPILEIERAESGDMFALLGTPVPSASIASNVS